ncbi:MAG: alkaline shock response membrane anchor protein AmaP [Clostridia bacterium]|nr:alkaline shock response membrane anchor protein AmaP [Clostridia bacterium]
MKVLEKIALVIYSYIVLILAVIACTLVFGWLKPELVTKILEEVIAGDIASKVTLGISVVFILLSIKCIFFGGKTKSEDKKGILLQNENGKLLITKETIDNLTKNVVKGFENIEQVSTKATVDNENNLIINVNLEVGPEVIVKELSSNLQFKIMETIKNVLDLEVKQVNVKVNNYSNKQEKKVEE